MRDGEERRRRGDEVTYYVPSGDRVSSRVMVRTVIPSTFQFK